MCEHRGWLLAAVGRALSPCHRNGLGGVAPRRGWVPATSEGDMHRSCGAGSQTWLGVGTGRAASPTSEPGKDLLMQDRPQPAPEVLVGVDIVGGKHYACAL